MKEKNKIFSDINTQYDISNVDLKSFILFKDSDSVLKYWNLNISAKYIIIECLNNMSDKKEHIKWALKCILDLFNFSCKKQQINFVLFVVLNFNNKYYAKITSGKIVDWCDLTSNKIFYIDSLHNEKLSSWWLKGFNVCSQIIECCICYEKTQDNIKNKCGHIFCRNCIGQHIKNNIECSYCRSSLLCDRRGRSYDNDHCNSYLHNN